MKLILSPKAHVKDLTECLINADEITTRMNNIGIRCSLGTISVLGITDPVESLVVVTGHKRFTDKELNKILDIMGKIADPVITMIEPKNNLMYINRFDKNGVEHVGYLRMVQAPNKEKDTDIYFYFDDEYYRMVTKEEAARCF